MKQDHFQGKWQEVKAKLTEKWNKLSPQEVEKINGNFEQLCAALQKAYGLKKEQVDEHLRHLIAQLSQHSEHSEKKQGEHREKGQQPEHSEKKQGEHREKAGAR